MTAQSEYVEIRKALKLIGLAIENVALTMSHSENNATAENALGLGSVLGKLNEIRKRVK